MDFVVVAGYFACAFFGILFGIFICHKKPDGVFKVDVSDRDKDKFMLELHVPLDDVPSKKRLVLTVANVSKDS